MERINLYGKTLIVHLLDCNCRSQTFITTSVNICRDLQDAETSQQWQLCAQQYRLDPVLNQDASDYPI